MCALDEIIAETEYHWMIGSDNSNSVWSTSIFIGSEVQCLLIYTRGYVSERAV